MNNILATKIAIENAVKKRKLYIVESQEIIFDKDLKIETAIKYNDTNLTLQHVLTATRWVGICEKKLTLN